MLKKLLLAAALMLFASTAIADEQLNGVGSVYWMKTQAITNTTACIAEQKTPRCALFPAGTSIQHKTRVVVASIEANAGVAGPVSCAWVGNSAATLAAAIVTESGGLFGTTGAMAGFRLHSLNVKSDEHPNRRLQLLSQVVGTWRGLCSVPSLSAHDLLYAPCLVDNDCKTSASAGAAPYTPSTGTCVTQPSAAQAAAAGMKLICVADSAGPFTVDIVKQYLQKEGDADPPET